VTPPKPLSQAAVAYPANAHGSAEVELELVVDLRGAVTEIAIIRGGETPLGEAARLAAAGWRFEPAVRDAQPVKARIRFVLTFTEPVEPNASEGPAHADGDPAVGPNSATPAASASPSTAAPVSITVVGRRPDPAPSFTSAEVRQLPGAFGDPFRAVEAMPGVTPIASGAPYFYVRGAPPGNVGYYYDGVRVPVLFHAAVGPAVIAPWFVDEVKLYPGGYPANFGRFAGGIVTANAAEPKNEWRGAAGLRVFDVGGMVEAPFANGRGNVMAGGRYSYSAAAFSLFSPGLDIGYWDYQARAAYDISPDDRLSVLAFGAFDFASEENDDGTVRPLYDVTFHRLDIRYDHRFSSTRRLRLAATTGADRTLADDQSLGERETFDIDARLHGARAEYVDRLAESVELRAGADLISEKSEVVMPLGYGGDVPYAPPQDQSTFGARSDVVWGIAHFLTLVPGVRFDVYRTRAVFAIPGATVPVVEPRLSARFRVSERVELFHDFGLAHQMPSYVVPISGFQPMLSNGLQRSLQMSGGISTKWPGGISTTITLFQNVTFNSTDLLSIAGLRAVDETLPDDARSLGRTVGAELLVKRDLTRRLGGFLAYTLSRSTRSLGRSEGPAWIDRTHVLNFAVGYDLGRNWRLGGRLVFYTGVPAKVAYPSVAQSPPRTRPFYRIDWRLEKRWPFGERRQLSLIFEFLNTTLNREVLRASCSAIYCAEEVFGPISVPSIGVEAAF
jgi:TonB family protein